MLLTLVAIQRKLKKMTDGVHGVQQRKKRQSRAFFSYKNDVQSVANSDRRRIEIGYVSVIFVNPYVKNRWKLTTIASRSTVAAYQKTRHVSGIVLHALAKLSG